MLKITELRKVFSDFQESFSLNTCLGYFQRVSVVQFGFMYYVKIMKILILTSNQVSMFSYTR